MNPTKRSGKGGATMRVGPAEGETIGERTYRRIRGDIVFGHLAPGLRLTLDRLRATYGTSINTLREVLNRLSSEGLIVAEGSRGFEVAPVSPQNLLEVASMRQLLEGYALRESFAAGNVEWESRVVSAHHKLATMERRIEAGERSEAETWKRYDWEFHHALISACGSQVLLDTHAAIYDRYLRYQMIAAVFRGEISAGEHRGLVEAALARDADRAQAIIGHHIQGCVEHMVAGGLGR